VQVERAKALFAEGRGRTQLAGAERRQRTTCLLNDFCSQRKPFRKRHQSVEADTLDFVAVVRGGTR